MATPLVFSHRGENSSCHLVKVDRTKLYGYVEKVALDENEQLCTLATLSGDGHTLIGTGGITFAYFSPDGLWCEKSELQAVNLENEPVKAADSSFKAPIALERESTVQEYLSHQIRLVYALDVPEGLAPPLEKALQAGTIFSFPFSYRGSLDPDTGFLLQGQDGAAWLLVGKPASIRMVGLSETGVAAAQEPGDDAGQEEDDDTGIMDFGLI